MRVPDILHEFGELGIYSTAEWNEYVSFFEIEPSEAGETRQNTPGGGEIASRIIAGRGAQIDRPDFALSPKIQTAESLSAADIRRKVWIGCVSGAFDLLHLGHLRYFKSAAEYLKPRKAALVAMTLSDFHIRSKKGKARPVLSIDERTQMLAAVGAVDYVVPLDTANCLGAIEALRPEWFFKSDEDLSQPIVRQEIGLVRSFGGQVVSLASEKIRVRSTTSIIESLRRSR